MEYRQQRDQRNRKKGWLTTTLPPRGWPLQLLSATTKCSASASKHMSCACCFLFLAFLQGLQIIVKLPQKVIVSMTCPPNGKTSQVMKTAIATDSANLCSNFSQIKSSTHWTTLATNILWQRLWCAAVSDDCSGPFFARQPLQSTPVSEGMSDCVDRTFK